MSLRSSLDLPALPACSSSLLQLIGSAETPAQALVHTVDDTHAHTHTCAGPPSHLLRWGTGAPRFCRPSSLLRTCFRSLQLFFFSISRVFCNDFGTCSGSSPHDHPLSSPFLQICAYLPLTESGALLTSGGDSLELQQRTHRSREDRFRGHVLFKVSANIKIIKYQYKTSVKTLTLFLVPLRLLILNCLLKCTVF